MRTLPIALVASLAALAGCGGERAHAVQPTPSAAPAAIAPAAVALPVDLLGTWTDPAGGGFVAFGARQVVVAVDGAPRTVAAPVENLIEPGMGAGRIGLAGGVSLFLARLSLPVGGLPVEHIDIEIVQPGGAALRRRLASEQGLRMVAHLAASPLRGAPPPAAPAVDPDSAFIAAVPPARRALAEHLVGLARSGAGAGEIAAAFGNRQRIAYAAILTLIEQARALGSAQAAERLAEADRRRADAESFSTAWRAWMAGRG